MSRVISESHLGFFAAETLSPLIERISAKNAVAEAIAGYNAGIGRLVREDLIRSIQPAALLAANTLKATVEAQIEEGRRAHEALIKMGWWFPPSAPATWLYKVGRVARSGKRIEVRRAMVSAGASRWLRRTVDGWMELDVFRDRRRFILDGLKQHQAGAYRIAIPVLLPHLEGIAMDAFEPGSKATSPKEAVKTAAAVATVTGPSIVEAVTILWAYRTFSDVPAGTRQLNRHLVLHGRSTGFGTAENSVKTLFAFDLLAAVIREAEEEQRRGQPS